MTEAVVLRGAPRVLCVGRPDSFREAIEPVAHEYALTFASSAFEAMRVLERAAYDACILDYWLEDWSGPQLCRHIRAADPHVPVLFHSAAAQAHQRMRALRAGASAYVCTQASDGADLRTHLAELIGRSTQAERVATAQAERTLHDVLDQFADKLAMLARAGDLSLTLLERAARSRVYRVFVAAGGTRASFDRWWCCTFAPAVAGRRDLCRRREHAPSPEPAWRAS